MTSKTTPSRPSNNHPIRCEACGRRCRDVMGWSAHLEAGVLLGYTCPGCKTDEEKVQSVVNAVLYEYGRDALGRYVRQRRQ